MISIFQDNDDWRKFHNASVSAEKRGDLVKAHKEAINAFLAYDGPAFPNGYAFNALRRRIADLAIKKATKQPSAGSRPSEGPQ